MTWNLCRMKSRNVDGVNNMAQWQELKVWMPHAELRRVYEELSAEHPLESPEYVMRLAMNRVMRLIVDERVVYGIKIMRLVPMKGN